MEGISDDEPIVPVPPPWKLKGTVYMLSFWNSKASTAEGKGSDKTQQEDGLPAIAYSPLEAESSFADPAASGEHLGGLSQIQIIRYAEDWNIPKHLARFEWDESLDGKTRVAVYPYDTAVPRDGSHGAVSESGPSDKPFLQAIFQPVLWAPSFPLSLSWLKYVGINTALVQPPLPDGRQSNSGGGEELIGTSRWCRILPDLSTRKAVLGWIDMSQHGHDAADDRDDSRNSGRGSDAEYDNFWLGLRCWNVAIKMENADIIFGEGLYWDPLRSGLY
ncbi:hypothetical protein E0Z10_g10336 [Xylaria hypoxylon]|uniref:Uncharacterized protein n=1 Tax=Xylaria hypoxylon TaxID=37992 RepID=A0A4Z0YL87_9PEZI|nr:hypothetical protein E0Z10_g10336 [Xylaria hypoxylon]